MITRHIATKEIDIAIKLIDSMEYRRAYSSYELTEIAGTTRAHIWKIVVRLKKIKNFMKISNKNSSYILFDNITYGDVFKAFGYETKFSRHKDLSIDKVVNNFLNEKIKGI